MRLPPFLVGGLLMLALLAPTGAGQPLLHAHYAVGVVVQDESHHSGDYLVEVPSVCLPVVQDVRVTLGAVAWTPGDVLTLRAKALGPAGFHVVSGTTSGTPPAVTLQYTSSSGCVEFWVEGTQVLAAAAYMVTVET